MDRNRVEGKAKQIGGKLRNAWGKVAGRPEDRIAGKIEEGFGKVQAGVGRLKDEVRAEQMRKNEKGPRTAGRD